MLALPSRLLQRPALLRALSCCAAEAAVEGAVAPKPGSVAEYHQHLLLQLPAPPGRGGGGSSGSGGSGWWPQLVEKEPAVVAAFAAVARHEELIGGKVKITAFDDPPPASGQAAGPALQPGRCNLLAFPAGLRYDGLSLEQLSLAVVLATAINPNRLPFAASDVKAVNARMSPAPDLSIFVCCHAARDARCGAAGPPLATALQQLVRKRRLGDHVRVLQTSHLGGHKYAGNVVTYGPMHPCDGDWFGGLHAGNAEAFLDALMAVELGVDGGAGDPALRPFWRGRMGLEKEEQMDLFQAGGGIEEIAELSESEEGEEGAEEDERLLQEAEAEWQHQQQRQGRPE